MRIFVISPVYPNKENPTLGVFVHEQNKVLADLGHEVIVLDVPAKRYNKWFSEDFINIKHSIRDQILIYSLPYRAFMTKKFPRIAMNSYIKQLKKIYEQAVKLHGEPDIIHAHFTFTSGYASSILSAENKVPFIVTEHHSLFLQKRLNKYYIDILKRTIDNSKAFITVSDHLKTSIIDITKTEKKVTVIPNMINSIFKYYPISRETPFKFFAAGNLVKSKNFSMLLKAFCEAFNKEAEVVLEIAGSGSQEKNLKHLIKKYNRYYQIKLLGRLDRIEILERYKDCNCFILTSKFETFGLVYREAMAVGRPIISSKNGGIEEGWRNDFGILLEHNDIESCKKAMKQMVSNFQNFNLKLISDETVEKYSEINFSSRIDSILRSCC